MKCKIIGNQSETSNLISLKQSLKFAYNMPLVLYVLSVYSHNSTTYYKLKHPVILSPTECTLLFKIRICGKDKDSNKVVAELESISTYLGHTEDGPSYYPAMYKVLDEEFLANLQNIKPRDLFLPQTTLSADYLIHCYQLISEIGFALNITNERFSPEVTDLYENAKNLKVRTIECP